jgi:hypothetical protein
VAICNQRLVSLEQGRVSFSYKDYADNARAKQMTLDADEFIRRFLLHVLPKGFVRIRHYGLLAGRNMDTKLADCRRLLSDGNAPQEIEGSAVAPLVIENGESQEACLRCPRCQGPLQRRELQPIPLPSSCSAAFKRSLPYLDTS